jgi:UDP-N-acetylmuramoyl-L-alanyl-D-glutamate--2,6-diaminopimelate ligase
MLLKEIVQQLHTVSVEGALDQEIAGIAYDSRRVTPGMVFVAVPGKNTDGHEYIRMALERGASAIICERNGSVPSRTTRIKVSDVREALASVAASYYQNPSSKLKVIGVTGTNGKTTVTFMIKSMLEQAGISTGLLGTVHYEIGERLIPAQRTTPESLEVQQMMAQMVRAGCKACVMEVSSHALEQKRVLGVGFDVAIFTNLTHDHLDYHGTMENYFAAKAKLFSAVAEGKKKAAAVINIDDTFGARLAGQTGVEVQLTYGIEQQARLRATQIQLSSTESRFTVETPDERFACRVPLIGRHNIYNSLAAIGAGLALKMKVPVIQKALSAMPPVPGRLQRVEAGQNFGVYVDYAHTDDALRNVLRTLREVTSGRLLLTFGCGGNRDSAKRAKMGKIAATMADYTIITSDNPRKESAEQIAAQIEEGYRSASQENFAVEIDRQRAIYQILGKAQPGDSVLIAGKGHETYQEFEDTVVPFDDRVHAQEALEQMGFVVSDQ